MPSSLLFGINNEGRVFGLSTNGTKWREFVYIGLEFKQLSAVPNYLWAVGSDRQIYVHVHGLDIPIRVKEEAYENERWTPMHGFSGRLLPTDRYQYSSQDGSKDRGLKKIRLPSMAWQWESDWHLELTLDGQPLDHDGWTYAVDFPAKFYPTKQWTSCVRRRKWIRYRRYSAMNSWCAIAPLHKDATQEPFIGVAAGGHEAGFDGGKISVWAVTANGRVMCRIEVSSMFPEGQRWSLVPLPAGCEVLQISVGSTGLVWAVLQNGKALVRTGVTRECIIGTGWAEVAPPDGCLLNQVSLGCRGLWALTRDQRVWFRLGITAEVAGVSEKMAKGSAWVEMIGKMALVSVAPNDQVFAIGASDKLLYFRTGVSADALTGKTWRQVGAPTQMSRTASVASLFSGGIVTPRDKRHRSWTSLNRHSGSHETTRLELDFDGVCHSAPALTRAVASVSYGDQGPASFSSGGSSGGSSSGVHSILHEEGEFRLPEIHEARPKRSEPSDVYENTSHPVSGPPASKEQWIKKGSRAWSPIRSCGSIVGVEAHSDVDSSVFDSETMMGVYGEVGEREEEDDHLYWTDSEAFWSSVEAGACIIHSTQLPNWFSESTGAGKADLEKPWRLKILQELRGRVDQSALKQEYVEAVDTCSWVKTADIKCLVGEVWQEASLSLEWVEGGTEPDYGTITISCTNMAVTHAQCNVADLTAVIRCSEPGVPRIALHRGMHIPPVKMQFSAEEDLDEWIAEMNELCCQLRALQKSPGPDSLWVTTTLGDVLAFDSAELVTDQGVHSEDKCVIEVCFAGQTTPIRVLMYNGFPVGSRITVHGCVPDNAERFALNLACNESGEDVVFHFNPRLSDECVVRNAKKKGVWGPEDRRGAQPFVRGQPFVIEILCENEFFRVNVDGLHFTDFFVRDTLEDDVSLSGSTVTHLILNGDVALTKVEYCSQKPILDPASMFFRHVGGHLRKLETAGGITWGIGYDNTVWVYTGGTGGPFVKSSESSKNQPMHDGHTYFVYENQRWNPLTGYTSHGLPTDRHMWSDVTGRHKRTKEKTKLLSRRWQWENEWAIDFSTPGGTDKEGWQYAVDFPATYHGTKHLTDYVRRRRWRRRARLLTTGPWVELGHTPLADCSLHVEPNGNVIGWGVALNGDVLFRRGLSTDCHAGVTWEHEACDEPIVNISGAPGQLWGVGRTGCAYWRFGITPSNPCGSTWDTIDPPRGVTLKMVSAGAAGIWALDSEGRLSVRREVSSLFPSGSSWKTLALEGSTQALVEGDAGLATTPLTVPSGGFRHVSSSSHVWAIAVSGRLMYRSNISADVPAGSGWIACLDANCCLSSGC